MGEASLAICNTVYCWWPSCLKRSARTQHGLPQRTASSAKSVIQIPHAFQLVGIIFAALLGLAFGSFLNVLVLLARPTRTKALSRRAHHCRHCEHTLAWWENIPLLSWIMLRGRCRSCRAWIGVRYPIVELAVSLLWTGCWLRFSTPIFSDAASEIPHAIAHSPHRTHRLRDPAYLAARSSCQCSEPPNTSWLPDWLTLPGIAAGFLFTLLETWSRWFFDQPNNVLHAAGLRYPNFGLAIGSSPPPGLR